MKKIVLIVFLFASVLNYAQNSKLTLDVKNESLLEALKEIENNTSYKIFYLKEWFLDSKKITAVFSNAELEDVLDELLKETKLNYYVLDERIILTQNNRIHASIYEKDNNVEKIRETTTLDAAPVIVDKQSIKNSRRVVKIGKEKRVGKKKYRLYGYVYNSYTKSPISDIVILNRKKNIYTVTDKNGFYSIELPYGKNTLETILSGFENKTTEIILYNEGKYDFKLKETSSQLDEVIVKASAQENIKSNTTGISYVKAKEIKTIPLVLGERDIIKVATTLPGVKSAGEGSQGVNVRGGKTDQNLFLLDNGVLYNPTHFLGLFSAVNPFIVDDLKVYKGSVPVKYGGRISSVFDIKTIDENIEKISGEISVGPVTGNVSIHTPIKKGSSNLLFGARTTYSNWLLKAIDNESLKNSEASFWDVLAKYNHTISEKDKLRATVYLSSDKYSIASDTTNSYQNSIISVEWKRRFNKKNKGSLVLSNSTYKFDIDYDGPSDSDFILDYNINESNLKLDMEYLYSDKYHINYGLSSKLYQISPGSIRPKNSSSTIQEFSVNKEKGLENALYVSGNINFNKKISMNIGLRYSLFSIIGSATQRIYDKNSPKNNSSVVDVVRHDSGDFYKSYQGVSFRWSGRYSFTEDLSIKAGVSNMYQYIHRLTNNTTASPTDIWKLSDPNIKPQQAAQASLGLFKNIDGNKYELSLEGYYKKYKNLLDYKVGADFLLNEYIETEVLQGDGKSYGVEFLIRKKQGRLNGWLSYTYSRSFLKFNSQFSEETINRGEFFPANFDKPHDFNLIANYKLTKRFSLSANATYQTGKPVTYPVGKYVAQGIEYVLYSDRNKFRIPDYYRVDLGINIEGNHKKNKIGHSFWNISVYNLLGRNNPNSIFFVTEEGKVKGYQSSIFSRPIPTITYNISF